MQRETTHIITAAVGTNYNSPIAILTCDRYFTTPPQLVDYQLVTHFCPLRNFAATGFVNAVGAGRYKRKSHHSPNADLHVLHIVGRTENSPHPQTAKIRTNAL